MKKLQQIFGLFFYIIIVVSFVNIVFANTPGVPHQFYGKVKINGNPAPDGVEIKVYDVDDNVYVAGTFTKEGKYGYKPIFYVPDPDGNRYGHTLEFYVAGVKATEHPFENGMSTKLDLSVKIQNFCGDGICDSGERCTTCPEDCGACPTGGSGGSGGSSGSGGGGGWSTSGGIKNNSNVTTNNTTNEGKSVINATKNETCIEKWKCTEWFECFNGKQKRVCMDLNECGTEFNKPPTTRKCEIKEENITTKKTEKVKSEYSERLLTGKFLTSPLGIISIFGGILGILAICAIYFKKFKK